MPRTRALNRRGARAARTSRHTNARRNTPANHNAATTTDSSPRSPLVATRGGGNARRRGRGRVAGVSQVSQQGGSLAAVNEELRSLIREEIHASLNLMRPPSTAFARPHSPGPPSPDSQLLPGPSTPGKSSCMHVNCVYRWCVSVIECACVYVGACVYECAGVYRCACVHGRACVRGAVFKLASRACQHYNGAAPVRIPVMVAYN